MTRVELLTPGQAEPKIANLVQRNPLASISLTVRDDHAFQSELRLPMGELRVGRHTAGHREAIDLIRKGPFEWIPPSLDEASKGIQDAVGPVDDDAGRT